MGKLAEHETNTGRQYTCRVATILASPDLDDDDRAAVAARFGNEKQSHHGLSEWLTDNGHPIAFGSVRKHRQRRCWCFRDAA